MADTQGASDFDQRLRGVVQAMVEDGVPDAQIRDFITKQKAGQAAQAQAQAAPPREPTWIERLTEGAKSLGRAGRTLSDVMSPVGTMARNMMPASVPLMGGKDMGARDAANDAMSFVTDPAKRRQLERGVSDATTGGYAVKIADKLLGPQFASTEQADQEAAPDYRSAGALAGSLIPGGPSQRLAEGAMKMMGWAPRILRPALAAPVVAAAYSGGHADSAGHRGQAVVDALKDPMTYAGPAAGLALEVPGAIARRLSPLVDRYATAKQAGVYERPGMKALPKGKEGIQKASERGLDAIVSRDQELGREASARYQSAVAPELDKPVDTEAMRMRLLEGRQTNIDPDTGLPVRPEVDAAYNRAFDRTGEQGTVRGTLMRRRGLQQDAAFGSPNPTEGQTANRDVYHTFRGAVREASPAVAAADDAYTAHAKQAARRSDILFNSEENVIPSGSGSGAPDARPVDADPSVPVGAGADLDSSAGLRVGKARSAATTLGRIGDTNDPGLRIARFLKELSDQDPAFAQALEFIANKKALEGTRYGLPQLPSNLTGATAHFGQVPLSFVQQNARALGATAAAAPSVIGPGSLRLNPIMQAMQLDRERQRRAAETLRRGGK